MSQTQREVRHNAACKDRPPGPQVRQSKVERGEETPLEGQVVRPSAIQPVCSWKHIRNQSHFSPLPRTPPQGT